MTNKKIVYVDMDHTLSDYDAGFKRQKLRYPHLQYPQSEPGMFLALEPMPGAVEAYNWLNEHPQLDVYILTAPSELNPHSYTEKRLWTEKYLGMGAVKKLIITPNKGLNKGDFLIDDYISGKGQEDFEGRILQFGSVEFPDWPTVLKFFKAVK